MGGEEKKEPRVKIRKSYEQWTVDDSNEEEERREKFDAVLFKKGEKEARVNGKV